MIIRKTKSILLLLVLFIATGFGLNAQSPWPAEDWTEATNLTALYSGFSDNLSGAHWNSVKRELWFVINNPGTIVKLVENEQGDFQTEATWNPGGDLEGITQVDLLDNTVLIIEENTGQILEYDISSSDGINLLHAWDISNHIPDYNNGKGPEGIAFVPDEWLIENGFTDQSGQPYVSQNGLDGLIFVAHQRLGAIYVFDINRLNNSYVFVGKYFSNRSESAGLEFDRSTGYLYIWHNKDDNYLEVTDMSSFLSSGDRKFTKIKEFFSPASGNLEGIALSPAVDGENGCWLTVDGGDDDALRWFNQFNPCLVYADFEVDNSETCLNEPIVFYNNSVGICGSEIYSWDFGDGASPAAAEGAGPHEVIYGSSGIKYISLMVSGLIGDTARQSIEIIQIDTSLSINGNSLTANETEGSYQWIDCQTLLPIPGETNQVFTATTNGLYAVIITKIGCEDTSGCYNLVLTDIADNNFEYNPVVFPNPTSGELNIDLQQFYNTISIVVKNSTGQLISTNQYRSTRKVTLNINGDSGIYFVGIMVNKRKSITLKVLKNQ